MVGRQQPSHPPWMDITLKKKKKKQLLQHNPLSTTAIQVLKHAITEAPKAEPHRLRSKELWQFHQVTILLHLWLLQILELEVLVQGWPLAKQTSAVFVPHSKNPTENHPTWPRITQHQSQVEPCKAPQGTHRKITFTRSHFPAPSQSSLWYLHCSCLFCFNDHNHTHWFINHLYSPLTLQWWICPLR